MKSYARRHRIARRFASSYALGSFAFAFLFLGLAMANGFVTSFAKVLEWWSSWSPLVGALWAVLAVFFFPGALLMFLTMVWKLKDELEAIIENALSRREASTSGSARPLDEEHANAGRGGT